MRYTFLILVSTLLLALPACITIEEIYTFKKNGSGSMTYVIDMREMAPLLKMAQEQQEMDFEGMLEGDMFSDRLVGISGISKVEAYESDEELLFGVSFKFDDLPALNAALNAINSDQNMMAVAEEPHVFFKKEGNTFVRNHKTVDALNMDELLGSELGGEDKQQMDLFMSQMTFKVNMTFKKPVEAVYTAAKAEFIDKKNKQVEISTNFQDLIKDQTILNASIVTK